MVSTGFFSAGTARTHRAAGPPWRAGNVLLRGQIWGPLPGGGQQHGPQVPLFCWLVGARAGTCSAPITTTENRMSLGHHLPPSPSSLLSLQGRHGLPGPPGPVGPRGLPGESVEQPGKKGDRVSTSSPLTQTALGPPGPAPQGSLSAPRCSLLLLLAQAGEGISLGRPGPAPRCSLTPQLSTQRPGCAMGLSWAPSARTSTAWGTGGVRQCRNRLGAGVMLICPAGIPRS